MRETKSTNMSLRKLIASLKKLSNSSKVKIWDSIADNLSKPTRIRRQVNLSKINDCTKTGETIIVPGKVLGTGKLSKKVTVAAWRYSNVAFEKINKNGTAMSIEDLMKKNPKGNKVRIIG
jgi:large subunit ribosomal protein L18e